MATGVCEIRRQKRSVRVPGEDQPAADLSEPTQQLIRAARQYHITPSPAHNPVGGATGKLAEMKRFN